MKKVSLLILFAIAFGAVIPRAIELLSKNYIFGYDQGVDFQAVKNIVFNQKLTLIGTEVGGHGGFFQGPGWYYLLSIPTLITNGDPYGGMVLMFLISMSVIVAAFILAEKMFDGKTAFFITFLLAISPRLIEQARLIWAPFPISFLAVLFLFFLFRVLQKKKNFLPLLAITIGLMFHFEAATGVMLLIQLIVISPLLLIKRIVSFRFIGFSILGFLLTLFPLIIFDLRHDFIITKGLSQLVTGSANPSHQVTLRYFEAMFTNHFDVFTFNFLKTFQLSHLLWPVLLFILCCGTVLYVKDAKKNFAQKTLVLYLFTSAPLLFLISLLYLWPMWDWWILQLNIFYCFLLGIFLAHMWEKGLPYRLIPVIMLLIFLGSFINQTINFYKVDFKDSGGVHKIRGKLDAIDKIYEDAKGEEFGLLVFTPPIYTYAYDYLIWWRGKEKYHYIPHQNKTGLFYLLIEPDPHKPWTYEGWLETVVKTGTILETKELPSGFIVQKRTQ